MTSVGAKLAAVLQAHARDPAPFLDEAGDRRFHLERKAGIDLGLVAQEIEEIPLRHHRDERRRRVEVD